MSGVYLAFTQGVERRQAWHREKTDERILRTVDVLRSEYSDFLEGGFTFESPDLRVNRGLGKVYESSTVASKLYRADTLPADSEILADLECVLIQYERYVESAAHSVPAWR